MVLKAAKAAEVAALNAEKAEIERVKQGAAEQAKRTADAAAAQKKKKTGNPVQKQAQAKAAPKVSTAKSAGGGGSSAKSGGSKPGGTSGGSSRGSSGGSGRAESGDTCNSFVPGIKVLMVDGSTKPIEKVKAGDKSSPRTNGPVRRGLRLLRLRSRGGG
ncbi:MAG TPA: hypothetical protein VIU15_45740 [Streptomyces sp.]